MRFRRLLTPLAAAALAAAAGVLLPAPAATAAACSGDTGVTVVIDASDVGGSVATTCVADGGGDTAGDLFEVSHTLTRVQNYPGAVCKVDGLPGSANCTRMPPANAYWGLFWSDGSGSWTYSSEGVDSLNVPDGGGVAFAWQDGGDQDYPAAEAPGSEPDPTTSPSGGSGGSGGGGGSSGGSGSGGSGSASGSGGSTGTGSGTTGGSTAGDGTARHRSASGGGKHQGDTSGDGKRDRDDRGGHRDGATPSDEPTTEPTASPTEDDAVVAEPPTSASDGGMPVWLPPSLAGGLFVAAGAVALSRRRHTG